MTILCLHRSDHVQEHQSHDVPLKISLKKFYFPMLDWVTLQFEALA